MYAEFGEKEKSFSIIKKMVDTVFSYKDGGFPGDEDNGTMASWYVFAVLGFYPTCPGKPEYTVSGPIVKSAILNTKNGKIDILEKIKDKIKVNHFDLVKA